MKDLSIADEMNIRRSYFSTGRVKDHQENKIFKDITILSQKRFAPYKSSAEENQNSLLVMSH